MKIEDISLKDMSKYRSVWMGIAMLWVVFFHSNLHFENFVLSSIKLIGYGGVDIFMFAAGLGSYYSYLKDHSPLDYLKRRIIRLATVYVPFILVWIIVKCLFHEMSIFAVIGNLFGLQGFSSVGGEFNWYLTGIIICYLLTPYLASYIEKNKIGKDVILIIFLLLISTVFWNDKRMIISIIRLPIYTIGMIFAKYDKKKLTKKIIICEAIGFIFGSIILCFAFIYAGDYLWNYGFYWYPFILITPFICHIISLISTLLTKNKVGKKSIGLLSTVGNYSFEIYLVHIFLFDYLEVWLSHNNTRYNNAIWISSFIILIPCVMLLRFVSDFLKHILCWKNKGVEMKINTNSGSKKIYILIMALLLILQLGTLCYFGWKKEGFHVDELYTYYSSNITAGLLVNDRQWMERDALWNDFVVLPGEGFRYDVVWQMQSQDVHPPLYYFVFHTVCSLFPGVFSKWQGIVVNLLAYVGSYILLAYCAYTAVLCGKEGEGVDNKKAEMVSLLACLFWGFSAAVISGVMFIRMYQQLTFFVLLCLALHLRAIRKQEFKIGDFFLPLTVTAFLGFLTHYYYIIFHFFLGAGFCVYLLFKLPDKKKIKGVISYAAACAVGLGAALLYYPPALSHIFKGYRGTGAVSAFGDASNTVDRLRFFWGLFDDYVMNGTLSIWLLALVLLAVTAGYLKGSFAGDKVNPAVGLMLFTAAGYFFAVSKTALILGEDSNRYQLPVYGIWCYLLLYGAWSLAERLAGQKKGRFFEKASMEKALFGICCAAVLLVDCTALGKGKVFFLYEEEKEIMEFVKAHKDIPVVVFYHEVSGYYILWLSDELMEYPRVYLASMENEELIVDETIMQSDSLLVYVAVHEEEEKYLQGLLEVNENLSSYQEVAERGHGVWRLYEVK